MRLLRTQANFQEQKDKYPEYFTKEVFGTPSKTVPNQTKSMRELIAMHTRGQYVDTFQGQYDPDDELPDFSKMDTIARYEYLHTLKEDIQDFRQEMISKAEQRRLEDQHKQWLKDNPPTNQKSDTDEPPK